MLTILNSKDRNRAFIRFAVMFVVTMVLIICAAYVDFRGLPQARKNYLETRFEVQRVETLNQEEFVLHMDKASILLDSIAKNPANRPQLEILLEGKMRDLERTRQKDSSLYGKMNYQILLSFIELQKLKADNAELKNLASQTENLRAKVQELNGQLDLFRSRPQVAGY